MEKNKGKNVFFAENKGTLHKSLSFHAREQYKLLRTNLEFTIPQGVKCPIIGVTSACEGEGKSTTAVNLSYALAEKGGKVLLIDGDLRLPSLARKMQVSNSHGLTDLLMGKEEMDAVIKNPILENWAILPSGQIPPNPSELLGSERMQALLEKLKEEFDFIVIDLPPVNVVADALSIAKLLTGIVVVLRDGSSKKRELDRCMRQLDLVNARVLGCVMTNVKGQGKSKYRQFEVGAE